MAIAFGDDWRASTWRDNAPMDCRETPQVIILHTGFWRRPGPACRAAWFDGCEVRNCERLSIQAFTRSVSHEAVNACGTYMKIIGKILETLGVALALTTCLGADDESALPQGNAVANIGPKIQFNTTVYDFGKISAGEVVKHSFIFTNAGDQQLVITNVKPSCGCTAAGDWTREVEPGQTGTIPIQFNSANFGGPVAKMVTVVCNDKTQPVYLQIKGTVWKLIEVTPTYAVINVLPESSGGSATIKILNNMEEALILGKPEVNQPGFGVEIRTNQPGKEYELLVSTVPPLKPGNVQAEIRIPTSVTNTPTLTVRTWANVQPALSILPAQVTLPASPLPNKFSPVITIINNTTNPLALTEPTVTLPGVDFQLREVQVGRYYTIGLSFPQGFQLKDGESGELKVKSNNPKYAQITIPIAQGKALMPPSVAIPGQVLPSSPGKSATSSTSPALTFP